MRLEGTSSQYVLVGFCAMNSRICITLAPSTHTQKMSTHPPISKQRKWAKRAYWSVTLVAFVWLCLLLTNEVFYARVLPASSDSFLWRGGWDSDKHLTLNGRVVVDLPSVLKIDDQFSAEVIAYYNIWSMYRMGTPKAFSVEVALSSDSLANGRSGPLHNVDQDPLGLLIEMKSRMYAAKGQEISYTGNYDPQSGYIHGTYQSRSPNDSGTFWLWKE